MKTSVAIVVATLALAAVLVPLASHVFGQEEPAPAQDVPKRVNLVKTKRNLLSQHIWGTWEYDQELCNRLSDTKLRSKGAKLLFEKNEEATARITDALTKMAEGIETAEESRPEDKELLTAIKAVYATGVLKVQQDGDDTTTDSDFAVVSAFGEPMIAFRTSGPNGGLQLARIHFVRDSTGKNGLLFIGSENPKNPFRALKRVEAKPD